MIAGRVLDRHPPLKRCAGLRACWSIVPIIAVATGLGWTPMTSARRISNPVLYALAAGKRGADVGPNWQMVRARTDPKGSRQICRSV